MPRQLGGSVCSWLLYSLERSDASRMVMQLLLEKYRQRGSEWFNKVDVIESAGREELHPRAELSEVIGSSCRKERWAPSLSSGMGNAGRCWESPKPH